MKPPLCIAVPALLALATCAALPGCVVIQNVDDDQMPPAWREDIKAVKAFRDPSGVYDSDGQSVHSNGEIKATRLTDVFFPGQFKSRARVDLVELKLDPAGKLFAKASAGGATLAENSFSAEIDRATGWVTVDSIPAKATTGHSAMSITQSARFAVSPDGTLYVKARSSAIGVVWIVPIGGTGSAWGRWKPAALATP